MTAVDRQRVELRLARKDVGQVFREPVGDIDTEAGHPAIRPEPQCLEEVVAHLPVVPVQIGLLESEVVVVPLAVAHRGPRRTTEGRDPVGRWQFSVVAEAVAEDVAVTGRRSAKRGERLPKPDVAIGGVVRHDVDDATEAGGIQCLDHPIEIVEGAESRIDVAVVVDVIATVGKR